MINKRYTYTISAILVALILMPLTAGAYYYPYNARLYIPGIDDATYQPYTSNAYQPKPVRLNFDIFGGSYGNDSNNEGPARDAAGNTITLVSPDNTNIFAIIGGKKHFIPPVPEILAEYNYSPELVLPISQSQLNKYSRVSLVKVAGDKKIYYLTEGGMLRPMLNEAVMSSYGNRVEDAITISRVEFNFYPQNQYVFLENPLNRDVFQIVGDGKRYLTPMAVMRLGLTVDQVAPINQFEMDSYKILSPVVH